MVPWPFIGVYHLLSLSPVRPNSNRRPIFMTFTRIIVYSTPAAQAMMETLALLCLLVQLAGALIVLPQTNAVGNSTSRKCRFPAVYNFGDSNSDTGGASAALLEVTAPNGETFFRYPSGRRCDGRLIIDFVGRFRKNVCTFMGKFKH